MRMFQKDFCRELIILFTCQLCRSINSLEEDNSVLMHTSIILMLISTLFEQKNSLCDKKRRYFWSLAKLLFFFLQKQFKVTRKVILDKDRKNSIKQQTSS